MTLKFCSVAGSLIVNYCFLMFLLFDFDVYVGSFRVCGKLKRGKLWVHREVLDMQSRHASYI